MPPPWPSGAPLDWPQPASVAEARATASGMKYGRRQDKEAALMGSLFCRVGPPSCGGCVSGGRADTAESRREAAQFRGGINDMMVSRELAAHTLMTNDPRRFRHQERPMPMN